MNHSICCRAEHYETATDTSMIPVTCAYDEAYYMLLLKQSVVKIGGVAIAMEICRVSKLHPCVLIQAITRRLVVRLTLFQGRNVSPERGDESVCDDCVCT